MAMAARPRTGVRSNAAQQRHSNVTYANAAMLAAAVESVDINPKIAEIRSRVEELVRRYDDAGPRVDDDKDRDEEDAFEDNVVRTPARWRVGDVLLSTHRSLAKTGAHIEQSIQAEFGDDPEVSAAIGSQALEMGDAFMKAEEHAAQRHLRLANIHQALQQVGINKVARDDREEVEDTALSSHPTPEHQLKMTIDALYREKGLMTNQLQGAVRVQESLHTTIEQQAQELARTHQALRAQSEELRLVQEHNAKASEAANARTLMWREKYQASAKAATVAEAKVEELVAKVSAQSAEIVKHTFVLQTKTEEMERYKEIESARTRAAAAAQAATLADAQAKIRKTKAEVLEEKRTSEDTSKDLQEMKDKIGYLENALLDSKSAMQEVKRENEELAQRLREMQARVNEQPKSRHVSNDKDGHSTPAIFALRLRETSSEKDTKVGSQNGGKPTSAGLSTAVGSAKEEVDELSSSESEGDDSGANDREKDEESEVERDEKELNSVMQRVVNTVFPLHSVDESELTLDESIAQYEDPTRTPMKCIQRSFVAATAFAALDNKDMVPRIELDTLRTVYESEIDVLKQQYVDKLREYKTLVILQDERRQALKRERHRLHIEGLLQLVQTKFHAEQARRSERLQRAQESLKVLYQALRRHPDVIVERRTDHDKAIPSSMTVTPLKTLLRAAIWTLSTSAKRFGRGKKLSGIIHQQLTHLSRSTATRTTAVAAAMTIYPLIRGVQSTKSDTLDASCQTIDLLPSLTLQEQRKEAGSCDDCMLRDSMGLATRAKQQQDLFMLHLVDGIPLSATLVEELQRLFPTLSPDTHYLSNALRLALFHELVRFYGAIEKSNRTQSSTRLLKDDDCIQDVEVAFGSPRDTPYLRRKALEAIKGKSRRRNCRHFIPLGGKASPQAAPFTSTPSTTIGVCFKPKCRNV